MRIFFALVVMAALAGCSGQAAVNHKGKTQAQARADYDDCRGQAAMAAALAPKSKDYEAVRDKALDECMKAIGYEVK